MYWKNAFEILTLPTVATLLLFLFYKFYKKEKKPFQLYFNYYFSLMLIKLFLFTIKAHAIEFIEDDGENDTTPFVAETFDIKEYSSKFTEMRIKEELFFLKDIKCLTNAQIKQYKKKQAYELKEGHRCFNKAKKLCLMIPNTTDQNRAEKLFEVALATAAGYTVGGYSGVVAALITELTIYLKNSINEYRQMQTLLLEAQTHYDLAAFYKKVLEKG